MKQFLQPRHVTKGGRRAGLSSRYKGYLEHFSTQAQNTKKIHSEKLAYLFSKKVFLIFWRMKLSSLLIKNFPIFSQKPFFLYFGPMELLHFLQKKFSYILGNRAFVPEIKEFEERTF